MARDAKREPASGYLLRGGAVITVDPALGTFSRADVRVRDGAIDAVGPDLPADGAAVVDVTDAIVMPGFVDSHYHMWSALGRNFVSDRGFGYFPAKWATAALYEPEDFYRSVSLGLAELAAGGVTTVHNWSHNNRSPAHLDAELTAHRESRLRARYSMGSPDRFDPATVNPYDDLDRVQSAWFSDPATLGGLVHLGANLRGMVQSEPATFHAEMAHMRERGLPVSIHASQSLPNSDDAADYERRGYLGPDFLFCHYIGATDGDRAAMARTGTPLSFATHSELRLGQHGDPRRVLLAMRAAGITVSLSCDAASIAPPNMFEAMRFTWNLCVPWKDTDTEDLPYLGFCEVIEMATLNGARALGLGEVTGSLTPGKRADLIVIRTTDLNVAPLANIETTVVQSATPANVDAVMVDGRFVKRGGQLVDVDVAGIVARARESALRIRHAAGDGLAPVSDAAGNPVFRARDC